MNLNRSYSLETLNLDQDLHFFVLSDLEIWLMTLKNNGAPLLYFFKLCESFHSHQWIQTGVLLLQFRNGKWVKIDVFFFFVSHDLEIWQMTLKNNRAPLLCYFKLWASFRNHWWIQTGITVWKGIIHVIWVKIDNFLLPCDLEIWRMTLKNNRAPVLSNIKLCTSFNHVHHHIRIQTIVTVWKRLNWVLGF